MDSILGDSFIGGRRMRPATLEYALDNYPHIIVWLALGRLVVLAQKSCEGRHIVEVIGKDQPVIHLSMVQSDFDKCKEIAKKMTIPLFMSDTEQDWLNRAKAYIRESFR
jgi:hypothetical protein